ncbi:RICIN domain-containing protein [Micromonospora sp. DT233]|uniref:RICIN domain-containing protein n=1 Tax=Micromonospora sp. DT233 TaxID=3393432 RepID=UPI003CF6FBE5
MAVVMVAIGAPAMVTATPAQAVYVSVKAGGQLRNFAVPSVGLLRTGSQPVPPNTQSISMGSPPFSWAIYDGPPRGHEIYFNNLVGNSSCMDSNAAGQLYWMNCNNGAYQRWHFNLIDWRVDPVTGKVFNAYEIINTATGRCLDGNGQLAYTGGCNKGLYQRWFIR